MMMMMKRKRKNPTWDTSGDSYRGIGSSGSSGGGGGGGVGFGRGGSVERIVLRNQNQAGASTNDDDVIDKVPHLFSKEELSNLSREEIVEKFMSLQIENNIYRLKVQGMSKQKNHSRAIHSPNGDPSKDLPNTPTRGSILSSMGVPSTISSPFSMDFPGFGSSL